MVQDMSNNTFTLNKKWVFWLVVIVLLFWFLFAIKAILLPFVVGILLAYFLDPAADKLEDWGCSRTTATVIITLGFFSLFGVILTLLLPPLFEQVQGLIASLPALIEQGKHMAEQQFRLLTGSLAPQELQSAKEAVSKVSGEFFDSLTRLTTGMLQSGFALINLISLIVLTPVVAFYLLRDWDRFVAHINSLLPQEHAPVIREQLRKIDETISGFVRGTLNVMMILGAFYIIALSLTGLKFAILIGLIGGFMIIIPYVGTLISGAAAVGMALLQFDDPLSVFIVLGIFVTGQVLEGYVLTPRLVGEKVGLHPLWLIFGMLAGATLFGFVGVFLAVPVTAIIGVLARFAIEQYKHSEYYRQKVFISPDKLQNP